MDLDTYQNLAKATAVYPKNLKIIYPALGLAGEAGEVANKVKKIYRDHEGVVTDELRDAIGKELGDVLWYVQQVATDLDMSLHNIAVYNLKHLAERQIIGTLHGEGDDR
jgi:NTP pyrophosphatase (non-canonical NTP hydrolase)